jgi:uncharacterized protein YjbJ (UPF0337 family)
MAIEDRVKATAKNIEGKAQEAIGDLTGSQGKRKKKCAKVWYVTVKIIDS